MRRHLLLPGGSALLMTGSHPRLCACHTHLANSFRAALSFASAITRACAVDPALRNLILAASDGRSRIFIFQPRETNRLAEKGGLGIAQLAVCLQPPQRKEGADMRPLISVTQRKCNQVVSLSPFPEFSSNGNIWGIPPEVPPSDKCARADAETLIEKQSSGDSCGPGGEGLEGRRPSCIKK